MVLMRPSLGHRGSYAATALNVAQNLGWAIFELIVIGTAAAALSDKVFGFEGKWLWTILFGLLTAAMALAGPITVVRRFVRRFALWVVLASLVYLTWWTIDNADLGAAWSQPGGGESLWYGIDLMIALPASWLPLIADYTRFSRDGRSAFAGSAVGYLIPNAWLYALGALLVTTSAAYSDPTELMTSIAAGGLAAGLALLALTVDETDEAFANVYSTAVSLQNVLPRVPQRLLIGLAATAATVGALLITWAEYETFLFMLGSFFVPLFGVLLAHWLLSGARYTRADVFEAPAFRPLMIVAWLAGFCLYQWLHPDGTERVDRPAGERRAGRHRRLAAELRPLVRAGVARHALGAGADDRARRHGGRCVRGRSRDRGDRAGAGNVEPQRLDTGLPRVVCAASAGSTVVVVVDARPAARRLARRRTDLARGRPRVASRLRGRSARGRSRRRPLRRTEPALPLA